MRGRTTAWPPTGAAKIRAIPLADVLAKYQVLTSMKKTNALSLALLIGISAASAAPVDVSPVAGNEPGPDRSVPLPDLPDRAYSMPNADARVMKPGRSAIGLHLNSSNFVNQEIQVTGDTMTRFERETVSLDYRRGFAINGRPVEFGVQVNAFKDAVGFQNSTISAVEKFFHEANPVRSDASVPHGETVIMKGQVRRSYDGNGSGLNDVLFSVKTGLYKAPELDVAVRGVLNVALGAREASRGNFAGTAISAAYRLGSNWTVNGDVRATVPLEKKDTLGLPLGSVAYGWTLGIVRALSSKTSAVVEISDERSNYKTGFRSYDNGHLGLKLGVNHVTKLFDRPALIQFGVRENGQSSPKVRLINDRGADSEFFGRVGFEF